MKLGTYWTHNPPMHTQSQGKGPTFRFSGAIQQSRNVADRSPTCHLAASTVAHGRPASVTACLRWLPIWLPAVGDPAVIGLHRSGFADRSLNSRTARQLSPVPGPSRLQRGLHHAPQRHLQLSHNLPSCLAHAAAPLMTDCQEARGGAALSSQPARGGTHGRIGRAVPLQNLRYRRGRRTKYPPIWAAARSRPGPLAPVQIW